MVFIYMLKNCSLSPEVSEGATDVFCQTPPLQSHANGDIPHPPFLPPTPIAPTS